MSEEQKIKNGRKLTIIGGIAVVLVAFIVGIGIYNMPANKLSRRLDLGQRYLEEQNYEQAIVEFDKAIEIDPMSVEAYLGKAQAYDGMGDIEMAMQTLETGYERTRDDRLLEMMQLINPIIEWEDAAFESLIREYLGKPERDIRKSEVCEIERLYIYGIYIIMPDEVIASVHHTDDGTGLISYGFVTDKRTIQDEVTYGKIETLNDLKYFISIKRLVVRYNENISDISGLGNLTNLEDLEISWNNISNISALRKLTNLTGLGLSENNISDIRALESLVNLTSLGLSENNISDIRALGSLVDLTDLSLSSNNINDISALGNLTNLTSLELSRNNISDISILGNLTNLTRLEAYDNNISDISALGNLTNLTALWLWENNISDISALENLTNLIDLELADNNISDISVLGNLTNLTELSLYNNDISDVSILDGLSNLTDLYYW